MTSNRFLIMALVSALIISLSVLSISIFSMVKANKKLGDILNITPVIVQTPTTSAPTSIDEQILKAKRKMQSASRGIRTKKVQISLHASNAIRAINKQGENNLKDAIKLMEDITENTKLVLVRNEEIEAESLKLYSLYQRKIETILTAKKAQKKSSFGLPFWAGLLGLLGTISGIVLAWRKDNLEYKKEKRELIKLQHEIAQV